MSREIHKEAKSGFTYTACIDFETVTPTTEHDFFLIKNPSGSGVDIYITHMNFALQSTTATGEFRIYASPTITADGTALTEVNMLVKSSPAASAATTFKNPTISASGSLLSMISIGSSKENKGQNRDIVIEPDNELLITATNDTASVKTFIQVYWTEK